MVAGQLIQAALALLVLEKLGCGPLLRLVKASCIDKLLLACVCRSLVELLATARIDVAHA